MDYKYFITEITTSNRLVFKESTTTAVNKQIKFDTSIVFYDWHMASLVKSRRG